MEDEKSQRACMENTCTPQKNTFPLLFMLIPLTRLREEN